MQKDKEDNAMKKIMAVCCSGIGSSFIIEMNISKVLKELGASNQFEVGHTSLFEVVASDADIFVVGKDLAHSASHLKKLVILNSLLDKDELKEKLREKLEI